MRLATKPGKSRRYPPAAARQQPREITGDERTMEDQIEIEAIGQAAFCKFHGLSVKLSPDPEEIGKFCFMVSPAQQAQALIREYEAGATAPAKRLLRESNELHGRIKSYRRPQP
jgi:hypothetical protein